MADELKRRLEKQRERVEACEGYGPTAAEKAQPVVSLTSLSAAERSRQDLDRTTDVLPLGPLSSQADVRRKLGNRRARVHRSKEPELLKSDYDAEGSAGHSLGDTLRAGVSWFTGGSSSAGQEEGTLPATMSALAEGRPLPSHSQLPLEHGKSVPRLSTSAFEDDDMALTPAIQARLRRLEDKVERRFKDENESRNQIDAHVGRRLKELDEQTSLLEDTLRKRLGDIERSAEEMVSKMVDAPSLIKRLEDFQERNFLQMDAAEAAIRDVRQSQSALQERFDLQSDHLDRSIEGLRRELAHPVQSRRGSGQSAGDVAPSQDGDVSDTRRVSRSQSQTPMGTGESSVSKAKASVELQALLAQERSERAALQERLEGFAGRLEQAEGHLRAGGRAMPLKGFNIQEQLESTMQGLRHVESQALAHQELLEQQERGRAAERQALKEHFQALVDEEKGSRKTELASLSERLHEFEAAQQAATRLAGQLGGRITAQRGDHQEGQGGSDEVGRMDVLERLVKEADEALERRLEALEDQLADARLGDAVERANSLEQLVSETDMSLGQRLRALEQHVAKVDVDSLWERCDALGLLKQESDAVFWERLKVLEQQIAAASSTCPDSQIEALERLLRDADAALEERVRAVEQASTSCLAECRESAQRLSQEIATASANGSGSKIDALERLILDSVAALQGHVSSVEQANASGLAECKEFAQRLAQEAAASSAGRSGSQVEALELRIRETGSALEERMRSVEQASASGLAEYKESAQRLAREIAAASSGSSDRRAEALERLITDSSAALEARVRSVEQASATGLAECKEFAQRMAPEVATLSAGTSDCQVKALERLIRDTGAALEERLAVAEQASAVVRTECSESARRLAQEACQESFAAARDAAEADRHHLCERAEALEGSLRDADHRLSQRLLALELQAAEAAAFCEDRLAQLQSQLAKLLEDDPTEELKGAAGSKGDTTPPLASLPSPPDTARTDFEDSRPSGQCSREAARAEGQLADALKQLLELCMKVEQLSICVDELQVSRTTQPLLPQALTHEHVRLLEQRLEDTERWVSRVRSDPDQLTWFSDFLKNVNLHDMFRHPEVTACLEELAAARMRETTSAVEEMVAILDKRLKKQESRASEVATLLMVQQDRLEEVEEKLNRSLSEGASLETGGKRMGALEAQQAGQAEKLEGDLALLRTELRSLQSNGALAPQAVFTADHSKHWEGQLSDLQSRLEEVAQMALQCHHSPLPPLPSPPNTARTEYSTAPEQKAVSVYAQRSHSDRLLESLAEQVEALARESTGRAMELQGLADNIERKLAAGEECIHECRSEISSLSEQVVQEFRSELSTLREHLAERLEVAQQRSEATATEEDGLLARLTSFGIRLDILESSGGSVAESVASSSRLLEEMSAGLRSVEGAVERSEKRLTQVSGDCMRECSLEVTSLYRRLKEELTAELAGEPVALASGGRELEPFCQLQGIQATCASRLDSVEATHREQWSQLHAGQVACLARLDALEATCKEPLFKLQAGEGAFMGRLDSLEATCKCMAGGLASSIRRLEDIAGGLHELEGHVLLALTRTARALGSQLSAARGVADASVATPATGTAPLSPLFPPPVLEMPKCSPELQRLRSVIDEIRGRAGCFDEDIARAMGFSTRRAEQRFAALLGPCPMGGWRVPDEACSIAAPCVADRLQDEVHMAAAEIRREMDARVASAEALVRAAEAGLDREFKRRAAELSARVGRLEAAFAGQAGATAVPAPAELLTIERHVGELNARLGRLEVRCREQSPRREVEARCANLQSEVRLTSALVSSLLEKREGMTGPGSNLSPAPAGLPGRREQKLAINGNCDSAASSSRTISPRGFGA